MKLKILISNLNHIEIGLKNNDIDFETSIKLSGARFVILKDKIALLKEL